MQQTGHVALAGKTGGAIVFASILSGVEGFGSSERSRRISGSKKNNKDIYKSLPLLSFVFTGRLYLLDQIFAGL